ncbi:MAG: Ferritin-like domain-containing protein [Deltaproteobacteria bacterium]|nr:Ferritin-like domain-containing protein [Deltaproteobacteria bacterium]
MDFGQDWSKWWRGFIGTAPDSDQAAIEILRQRYVEEMQGIGQLTQHADKMHYPQFREKLLHIAADKSKHAEWIGEMIVSLGAKLPEVAERRSTDENSWHFLQMDLAEEKRNADRLPEQIWRIESDHPDISKFLQRIFQAEKKHRQEIADMLMRSDGFALSLA